MFEKDALITLHENEFRLLRDLISDYCGIYYDNDSRFTLERRLNRRLEEHGFDNFRDYYRFLLYDDGKAEELLQVIDILTVNETYFFRENGQFKALIEEIIPKMIASSTEKKPIRIWSAGCASGEEPYSIAMHFLENPHLLRGQKVEIIASDINRRVLDKAKRGIYTKNSFRGADERYINKYFEQDGNEYLLSDKVKSQVKFSHLNLFDSYNMRMIGDIDIIFCRNVMIYFSQDARKKVVEGFSGRLVPGGYLLLGHAETLVNISTGFALTHLKNDMVYQKPKKTDMSLSDEGLMDILWGGNE